MNSKSKPSHPPRRAKEPAKWYHNFIVYYLTIDQTSRTIEAAHKASAPPGSKVPRQASSAWYRAARKYDWRGRAEAFDAAHQQRVIEDLAAERSKDHRRRIETLHATRARVLEALAALQPEEAKWNQIINGIVAINSELRKEYGEPDTTAATASTPTPPIRASDLDHLTDKQLDAVEAASRILNESPPPGEDR